MTNNELRLDIVAVTDDFSHTIFTRRCIWKLQMGE